MAFFSPITEKFNKLFDLQQDLNDNGEKTYYVGRVYERRVAGVL
jgi:hypothetical protein